MTQVNPKHRELVKAIAIGDTDRAKELNESIPQQERADYHTFVTAFFSIMLELRFKEDSSREAIASFVDEMRYDYRKADPPIKPMVIEGVIRASCGEEHLLDDISGADTLAAEYQVIGKIAVQSPEVIQNPDHYLDEAEGLFAEWESV
ncbi:MAG TPA: hypothetical protein H9881_06810 [Candidatus Stackebrandtia excrementipullorum]|nr:hypothetical protein [Candidatus Stackebrandtia excrementipullorum]